MPCGSRPVSMKCMWPGVIIDTNRVKLILALYENAFKVVVELDHHIKECNTIRLRKGAYLITFILSFSLYISRRCSRLG